MGLARHIRLLPGVHRRSRIRRGRVSIWVVALLLAGTAYAQDTPDPMQPVRTMYADHKKAVLELEATLRDTPDASLSGLPGFSVLLFSCEGAGCVGPHQVSGLGQDSGTGLGEWLGVAFPAGGWVPVSVPRKPGNSYSISWRTERGEASAQVVVPPPGMVTIVQRQADAVVVQSSQPVTAVHNWRVALAEQARGDYLAAAAVMNSGIRLHRDGSSRSLLLLGDLYRQLELSDLAAAQYRKLLKKARGNDAVRAQVGLARVVLDRGNPGETVAMLASLSLPADHPLIGEVNDLLVRAHLQMDLGQGLIQALPVSGTDPFVTVNRAVAYRAVGDTFSTINALKIAGMQSNRSIPLEAYLRERIFLALGTLYAEQGKLQESLEMFGETSEHGIFADRRRYGRALAFIHSGDLVKAVAELKVLERNFPASPYALEGLLAMADSYRRLNAPHRAVTEYRKALERFRGRVKGIDFLLGGLEDQPFDQGLTGLIFSSVWKKGRGQGLQEVDTGLQILFKTPGFSLVLEEYQQVVLAIRRLEGLNRRLARAGQERAAGRVKDGIERLGVFRTLYEEAARQVVIRTLQAERKRMESLSLTASLGMTQSLLFDRAGGSVQPFGGGR